MLRTLIGDDAFRRGMDLYFERYDGTAATVEDFISCFAEASGRDLAQFALWYSQAGTPVVTTSGEYDPAAKTYALKLSQRTDPTPGQSDKKPVVIPLALALFGENGQKLDLVSEDAAPTELARGLIELDRAERRHPFPRHSLAARGLASARLFRTRAPRARARERGSRASARL